MLRKKIQFYKMHGIGNDFILIDNRENMLDSAFKADSQKIQSLCTIHTGIGADGLMLLENSDVADFKIAFFNADGNPSTMCGNGVRCAIYLAHQLKIAPKICTFEILDVIYHAEVLEGANVRVKMHPPKFLTPNIDLAELLDDRFQTMMWLDTGVPHLVIDTKTSLKTLDVLKIGRELRYHRAFQPIGTNANFIRTLKNNHLELRVYERGVENETLACGTGAVACGIFANKQFGWQSPVFVDSPGGELKIEFDADFQNIFLNGGVTIVFEGTIDLIKFFKN